MKFATEIFTKITYTLVAGEDERWETVEYRHRKSMQMQPLSVQFSVSWFGSNIREAMVSVFYVSGMHVRLDGTLGREVHSSFYLREMMPKFLIGALDKLIEQDPFFVENGLTDQL